MNLIEKELQKIKYEMGKGFTDPVQESSLKYFILNGSKMIRSTITILYIKSLGFEINDSLCTILASGEIIHNASLLHDDVLDEQSIRRGTTTISEKFSPKVSILAGDYLLSVAVEKLLSLNEKKVMEIFKNCTKNMIESELKQYFLRSKLPTEEEYIQICKGKTASLFAAILKSCTVILNISESNPEKFATDFGICFQIKNDLDSTSALTDKKNKIFTAKDVLGIEKTSALLDNYKEEMRDLIKDIPDNIYKKQLEDLINLL